MNHNTLKAILVSLYLIIPASTSAWTGESATAPPSGQFTQTPGYYPATPGYYPATPGHGYAPAEVPRSDWNSGRRHYPTPWSAPPYGTHQPAPTPRMQTRQIRPPYQPADRADAVRARLQADLDTRRAELNAAREELQQTRALLEDAEAALDRVFDEYHLAHAGNKVLDAELATALAERDSAREHETELAIELLAAEKQLDQASKRLEQLEKRALAHTDERAEREL
ncbi:MAG: hypothetical protein OEN52_01775, partial [Gammaproteobacteria bacterium]|nr:hypothetical protein [Gammaproteobacteria bacterium]